MFWRTSVTPYATCTSPIMHLICPPKFAQALFSISLGMAVISRRNEKQRLCRILARANKMHYSRCASGVYNLSLKRSLSVTVALIHVSTEWDRFTWLPRVSEDETLPQEWTVKETTPVAGFDFALWYKIVRLVWTVTAFVIACCTVIATVTLHSNFEGVIITPLMGLI